ncbi:putative membrane protein [Polynucleobacter sphagniphilus]|uniref:hypothetical protein n=1 Tax=Polynucleobacter sphagniphilus TaxID=1743169 RepID=UPI00247310CB|nr:hypothetical protein [Polynucleobacter sphagniphilus]MDH6241196.1 putative membrane protein [Polynucleobacter sphagniphilus]MDH6301231.1 putative membrane protein [Polynucleobacter sphagniphilus]
MKEKIKSYSDFCVKSYDWINEKLTNRKLESISFLSSFLMMFLLVVGFKQLLFICIFSAGSAFAVSYFSKDKQ